MATNNTFLRSWTAANSGVAAVIDLESTGSTNIYDLAWGGAYKVPVIGYRIDVIDASSVTSPAVISIGTNSSDYDNLVKVLAIPGVVGWSYQKFFDNPILIPNNVDVFTKVIVAGAGSSFTAVVSIYVPEYQT